MVATCDWPNRLAQVRAHGGRRTIQASARAAGLAGQSLRNKRPHLADAHGCSLLLSPGVFVIRHADAAARGTRDGRQMARHLILVLAVLWLTCTLPAAATEPRPAAAAVAPVTFMQLPKDFSAVPTSGGLSSLERWGIQAHDLSVLTNAELLAKAQARLGDRVAVDRAVGLGDAYAAYLLYVAERARLPPHAMLPASDEGIVPRRYLEWAAKLGLVRAVSEHAFLIAQVPTMPEGRAALERMRMAAETGNGYSLALYAHVLGSLAKSEADLAKARSTMWTSADAGFAPAQQMRAQFKANQQASEPALPKAR